MTKVLENKTSDKSPLARYLIVSAVLLPVSSSEAIGCVIPPVGIMIDPCGPFQNKCNNIFVVSSIEGNFLYASCPDNNGVFAQTTIHAYDNCTSMINVTNGKINCSANPPRNMGTGSHEPHGGSPSKQPPGTWTGRCGDGYVYTSGRAFYATCRKDDNSWVLSGIKTDICASKTYGSIDGQLVCENGSNPVSPIQTPRSNYISIDQFLLLLEENN